MLYSRPLNLKEDLPKLLTLELANSAYDELLASSNVSPNVTLIHTALVANWVEVILEDDEIVGIFGLGKYLKIGLPWFVQGKKLTTKKLIIALHSKDVLKRMLEEVVILFNFVDSRNTTTIKWLKWLGFTVMNDTNFYLNSKEVPFKLFYMEK